MYPVKFLLALPFLVGSATAYIECTVGATYCGWYLADDLKWGNSVLTTKLATDLGTCTMWGDMQARNALWLCESGGLARATKVCDKNCDGPQAHCR
ncbi:hypothetical protein BCR34DRAFT_553000 [Clohesyomyces aquaticus]|uniref:Uncharacterized protein n=1 Tax=Clohesyomyces aquaticus TaxID=1231657 RepID=A0A1Y2A911_9PLEO|nr:hypothetical protein BCR34DRAFT_553000 [Clohesyomyces aquaticus]